MVPGRPPLPCPARAWRRAPGEPAFRALLAALTALVALGVATPASAQERQWRAGGGLAYADLTVGPRSGAGLGLEGNFVYGLTDQFNALVEVSFSRHNLVTPAPSPCPDPPASCDATYLPASTLTGLVGLAYTLDVTRVQPYGGVMVGGMRVSAGDGLVGELLGKRGVIRRFDTVLAAGVDYHWLPHWTLGLAGRLHEAPYGGSTHMILISLRVQYAFR